MKKFNHYFLLGLILIALSCNEDPVVIERKVDPDVNTAKQWFTQNFSSLKQATKGRVAFKSKTPIWEDGISYYEDGKTTIELPLIYDSGIEGRPKEFQNTKEYKNLTRLILIKNDNDTYEVFIMRVLPSLKSIANLEKNTYNKKQNDFTGEILYTDWNEKPVAYVKYRDGKRVTNESSYSGKVGSYLCDFVTVHWYQIACSQYGCYESYLGYEMYYVCVQYNPYESLEPPGGDLGGGGGSGNLSDITVTETITNNVTDPCISQQVNNAIAEDMTNEISTLIRNIYGVNDNTNLTIDQVYEPYIENNEDAITDGYYLNGFLNIDISFNGNTMPSASREYIMATLYHEFLHAILFYNGIGNGEQHEPIATGYISIMANALRQHFPNLSQADATSLAWGGLQETEAWTELSSQQQSDIIATNMAHKNGQSGTGCN